MDSRKVWLTSWNRAIADSPGGIIVYGAGINAARFLIRCKSECPEIKITCIADTDTDKQGEFLFGIPIITPESLSEYDKKVCIVVTPERNCLVITEKLNGLGFFNLLYYHTWNAQVIGSVARKNANIAKSRNELDCLLEENRNKIAFVRELLQHDTKSVAVFDAKLDSTYFGRHISLEALYEGNQYFPDDIIKLSEDEVFVDCGAQDGGTSLEFIRRAGRYNYIYSFEPDPWQFILTKMILESRHIENCEVYNYGVCNHTGELAFSSIDLGRSKLVRDGEVNVPVTTLDALLYNKPKHPTFIKMDIEGAELEALEGARKLIERDHPKLVISVYHGKVHLYEIPCWIKTNFPDYKVYLRQHLNVGETVCYAV